MPQKQVSPRLDRMLKVLVIIWMMLRYSSASAVTLSTQVQTISINPTIYVDYNYGSFLKFDTKLGTLRAVRLKVNWLSVGGSFTFNQMSSGSSTISTFSMDLLFYAASTLNNTANDGLISDFYVGKFPKTGSLAVTNQTLPKTISRRNSVTFNFDSNYNIITEPITVLNLTSANDLKFYEGRGISFAPAFTCITQFLISGTFSGNPVRDYYKLTDTVGMSLYYDYIPAVIPEPNYLEFSVSVALISLMIRRRFLARFRTSKRSLLCWGIQ